MFTGLIEEISSLENVKKTLRGIYCLSIKTAGENTDINPNFALAKFDPRADRLNPFGFNRACPDKFVEFLRTNSGQSSLRKQIDHGRGNPDRISIAKFGIKIGDSLAVNGVCLTVTGINNRIISFDVMGTTFKNTNLSLLKRGCLLNIERAILAGSPMGGHFVQGHVDGMVGLKNIRESKDGMEFVLSLNKKDRILIADKGSVALDGISLTVQAVTARTFSVFIIPHTFKNTNLKERKIGDKLNLEFDILAKYAARRNISSKINHNFLAKNGF